MDCFDVIKLFPTYNREWVSKFHIGKQRSYTFGISDDPELQFRGTGTYTIFGEEGEHAGEMMVIGSCPRIYVFDNIRRWNNVEVTFYCKTIDVGQNISYAGIEAVVRTKHNPDTELCTTRGYGAKLNFDGRSQFEKECVHGGGNKQVNTVYPFPNKGKMPLNQWIGMKFICRSCEKNTKCKLEIYYDFDESNNWTKYNEFTDYAGWSSDQVSCCLIHKGKILKNNFFHSVYLRTDGNATQYYKKFSIREIDALQ